MNILFVAEGDGWFVINISGVGGEGLLILRGRY